MNRYELVILVDTRLSQDAMNGVIKTVEDMVGSSSISQKDDIGMLDLEYSINGNERAYFVSYDLQLDPSKITEYKRSLTLTKGLIRFAFYKMGHKDTFLIFKDVNKMFELSEDEKQQQENVKAFQDMDSGSKRKGRK